MVLDTEPVRDPRNHSSVILGRPFLTTADAVIGYRNGVMTLSFENMKIELNIFHTSSQPSIMDDHEEVESVNHTFEESYYEGPLEKCLDHFGMNFDIEKSIEEVNALLDSVPIMDTNL